MTRSQPSGTALYGISIVGAGLFLGLVSISGLADSAGNLSSIHLAGALAGAGLVLGGAILAIKPADDPRPPVRYVAETALGWLDAAGELIGRPRAALWVMIPVLLLAAALRFYHLTFQSFWLDELMTWWRSSYNDLPTVLRSVESDVWPPGYSLWAYAVIHTIGASDFILRFFPALAGVLSVASTYTLGRRLALPNPAQPEKRGLALPNPAQPGKRGLGGHLAGLFGALLLGVLEISIYYSQEARPYSGLILFSILSTYFWLRVVERLGRSHSQPFPTSREPRDTGSGRTGHLYIDTAGYVLTALLAMYWNYYGLVLVVFQVAGAGLRLIGKPRTWLAVIGIIAVIGVGYLPWLTQTLADLGRDSYLPIKPGGYLDELMAFFRVLFNLEQNYVLAAIGLVAVALVADTVRTARGKSAQWAAWLVLLGWLLLPFTLTYARSLVSVSTFLHRYLLISLPAAALLPSLALARLPLKRWIASAVVVLAALVLLNNLVRHWDYYTRVTKAQFREVVEQVDERDPTLGGPSVIVGYTGYHGTLDLFDYYFVQTHSERRAQLEAGFGNDTSGIEKMVDGTRPIYIWVIAAQNKPAVSFIDAMGQKFQLIEHKELTQADVWLYAVK